MNGEDKPIVWLYGEVKTPPFTLEARLEAGLFLRRLQQRENLGMPHSRGPCLTLGSAVTNYGFGIGIKIGASCIGSMTMRL
jgi:hypothetical protein